ncbi:MAG: hypothetical protein H6733_00505 [Alphaproteobacteria bacterium]|nr:hypothetical protein [Alphaproteobacteria bacterium]
MTPRLSPKLALLAVLLGVPAVVVPTEQACATTFAPMSTEQFVDASTYVVRGTVKAVWTELVDGKYVWTRARVEVAHVFKGPDTPTELVVDSLGGVHGDVELDVSLAAQFSVGEEAIFFLTNSGKDLQRLVPVSKFLGVRILRRAPGDTRLYATTFTTDRLEKFDANFIPAPPASERHYMDDLVQSIEDRLDVGWDGQPIPGLSADRLAQINTPAWRRR